MFINIRSQKPKGSNIFFFYEKAYKNVFTLLINEKKAEQWNSHEHSKNYYNQYRNRRSGDSGCDHDRGRGGGGGVAMPCQLTTCCSCILPQYPIQYDNFQLVRQVLHQD